MTSWAIVAIPSKDDHVWKISSEKVPHLTILFLGDQTDADLAGRIQTFLAHVAKTSLIRFGLSVDRRGELGPDNADVLFFDKQFCERIAQARSYMLTNEDISNAYNSTEQYPEWTPHLTLGYPETPAKPDDREYPGISWVNFDRLALWVGDYEGPEILLKSDYDERAEDVSMSDIHNAVDEALAHYGIPGMKWGRRRPTGSDGLVKKTSSDSKDSGEDLQKSADFERAAKAYQKSQEKGTQALSNEEMKAITNRINAEKNFMQLTTDQKSELQRKVDQLKIEKEYRQLSSEKAKATRSTGRKIVDSLMQAAVEAAGKEASKMGKDLVEQMMGQKVKTKKTTSTSSGKKPMPKAFKVNPNKVKFSRAQSGGLAVRKP